MGLMTAPLAPTRVVALTASLLAFVGCTTPRTEVIVITDTNMAVPDQIDELRIEVTSPDGDVQSASAFLQVPGAAPPPRTLGLVHDDGQLGPFRVRAIGRLDDVNVIERVAVFTFQPQRTLVLRLDLNRDCLGTMCSSEMTCAGGTCRSVQIEPDELEPWDGTLPHADAGTPPGQDAGPPADGGPPGDGGECTAEVCNEIDDDCDDAIDEDFDLSTDADHCGGCGNACDAGQTCVDGTCTAGECAAGTADCNGDPGDGCEVTLGTDQNCASCGDRCLGNRTCCPSGGASACMMVATCP